VDLAGGARCDKGAHPPNVPERVWVRRVPCGAALTVAAPAVCLLLQTSPGGSVAAASSGCRAPILSSGVSNGGMGSLGSRLASSPGAGPLASRIKVAHARLGPPARSRPLGRRQGWLHSAGVPPVGGGIKACLAGAPPAAAVSLLPRLAGAEV
jgi:hypothetical protein